MRLIGDIWDTIESELASRFPAVLESLSPPAAESDLAQLEERLARPLPQELRESLRRHDGQPVRLGQVSFWNGCCLLSSASIIEVWSMWLDISANVEVHPSNDTHDAVDTSVVWHPGWIAFAETGAGDYYVTDLAPRSKGVAGQVFLDFEGQPSEILHGSYGGWLEKVAADLLARNYHEGLNGPCCPYFRR